jgi:hypothetical protein
MKAHEVRDDPTRANTLALVGIGNAYFSLLKNSGNLDDLNLMVGSLDKIAHTPWNSPKGRWGS